MKVTDIKIEDAQMDIKKVKFFKISTLIGLLIIGTIAYSGIKPDIDWTTRRNLRQTDETNQEVSATLAPVTSSPITASPITISPVTPVPTPDPTPAPASTYKVTFSQGREGWYIGNQDTIKFGGSSFDPDFHLQYFNPSTWGIEIENFVHKKFVGNYFTKNAIQVGMDIRVDSIKFNGVEVSRSLILQLEDDAGIGAYFIGKDLFASKGFQTMMFDIPLQEDFPAGWKGYDLKNGLDFPSDRTYGSVLRNVQRISFTTFQPGFAYGFTLFDIRVDNVFIKSRDN